MDIRLLSPSFAWAPSVHLSDLIDFQVIRLFGVLRLLLSGGWLIVCQVVWLFDSQPFSLLFLLVWSSSFSRYILASNQSVFCWAVWFSGCLNV